MIKLLVDQEYLLSPQVLASTPGREYAKDDDLACYSYTAFEDGGLASYCGIRHKDERGERQPSGDASLVAYLHDNQIAVNDISSSVGTGYHAPSSACAFGNQVLMILETDQLVLIGDRGLSNPRKIRIENTIPGAKRIYGHSNLRCLNGVLATPLQFVYQCNDMAFLEIQIEPPLAIWQNWPAPALSEVSSKSKLFKRIFRRMPGYQEKITPMKYFYVIDQALVRDNKVFIFSRGNKDSPKYGFQQAAISQIDSGGKILNHVFYEDFTTFKDDKKRGRDALFTSSGKYCCLSSHYKATDSWKGRQKLLDLDTNELIELTLPRGYTKYRLADHNGDYFWFNLRDYKSGKDRIIRCTDQQLTNRI